MFSVTAMCRVLQVTRSGYYAYRTRPVARRASQDEVLAVAILEAFRAGRGHYGAPRVQQQLRNRGIRISKRRSARLLREQGLRASKPPRRINTTDSRHDEPIAANLLAQEFSASAPNQKWAGDITYIPTEQGWMYLAVILDLFSRRVIGWAMSDRIDAQLTQAALLMAVVARRPTSSILLHSDRGVQYAAGDYRQMLTDWSLTASMSRRGNCYDNAVSESFFASLKKELVHQAVYASRAEAEAAIFEYIEVFYNRVRLHSTIGYMTPAGYEENWNRIHTSHSALDYMLNTSLSTLAR
jgi:putative transposase